MSEEFTRTFREEHRQVRDVLLSLAQAFRERRVDNVRSLLARAAEFTGPHFRYEEVALYPSLVEIFGEDYIEHMFEAHDRLNGSAGRLVALAQKDRLTEADAAEGVRLVQRMLPHVSDCDGLSIMVERLSPEKVLGIFEARKRSLGERLNLMERTAQIRDRPAVSP